MNKISTKVLLILMFSDIYPNLSSPHVWMHRLAFQESLKRNSLAYNDKQGKLIASAKIYCIRLITFPVGIICAVTNIAFVIVFAPVLVVLLPLYNTRFFYNVCRSPFESACLFAYFDLKCVILLLRNFTSPPQICRGNNNKKEDDETEDVKSIIVQNALNRLNRISSYVKSDFRFEIGKEKLEVHACVAKSLGGDMEFLNATFFKDSEDRTFSIKTPLSPGALLAFRRYLYTGDAIASFVEAQELFVLADRYGFERLKKQALSTIERKLKFNNVTGLLKLANVCDCPELSEICFRYLQHNRLLVKSEWQDEFKKFLEKNESQPEEKFDFVTSGNTFYRENPDLTLYCKDGVESKAHKLVLGLFSERFARLLNASVQRLDFPTISNESMEIFLDYLYECKFPQMKSLEDLQKWEALGYVLSEMEYSLLEEDEGNSIEENLDRGLGIFFVFAERALQELDKIKPVSRLQWEDQFCRRTVEENGKLSHVCAIQRVAHLLKIEIIIEKCLKKRMGLLCGYDWKFHSVTELIDEQLGLISSFSLVFKFDRNARGFSLNSDERLQLYQKLGVYCKRLEVLKMCDEIDFEEKKTIFKLIPSLKEIFIYKNNDWELI